MAFTRQFRALCRISGFFAGAWATVGGIIGAIWGPKVLGGSALGAAMTLAFPYGLIGGMAGALTVLVIARSESGKDIGQVPTWRVAVWGVVGGVAPAVLITGAGLFFGAPAGALLPLVSGLGIMGAVVGGVVSAVASAAAKTERLSTGEQSPQLPPL